MRKFALLAVSVVAVVVLGWLAVWAEWGSQGTVDRARRADRVTLQTTLAGLTEQYLTFTFLSTKTAADATTWHLQPGDPQDRAALRALVRTSPLTGYGAAVVSLSGTELTSFPRASLLPPADNPGFVVLRRELTGGQPGLSDVMSIRGTPVVAFAVPITRSGKPVALLVAFANLRTWPLQGYDAKLHVGDHAASYVVDSNGIIAASTDPAEIGHHLIALRHATGRSAGFVSYHTGRTDWDMSYGPAGHGWSAVTIQPAAAFSGALNHSRRLASLALASLLSIAVLMLVVFHHKRQDVLSRLAEERLYDPLTGLGQRAVFEMRLQAALARRHRHHRPLAVLFCDVDAFKDVNDRYGHNAGDHLLAIVARRIAGAIRDTDMAARVGGDEFAVIMEETSTGEAANVAERIRLAVASPLNLNGSDVTPGISVGGAVLTTGDTTPDALLHEADMAMYQAKRSRKGHQLVDLAPTTTPEADREAVRS